MKNLLLLLMLVLTFGITSCEKRFDRIDEINMEQNEKSAADYAALQAQIELLQIEVNTQIAGINAAIIALQNQDSELLNNIDVVKAELEAAVQELSQADESNLVLAYAAVAVAEENLMSVIQENVEELQALLDAQENVSIDLQAQIDAAIESLSAADDAISSATASNLAAAIHIVTQAAIKANAALEAADGAIITQTAAHLAAALQTINEAALVANQKLADADAAIVTQTAAHLAAAVEIINEAALEANSILAASVATNLSSVTTNLSNITTNLASITAINAAIVTVNSRIDDLTTASEAGDVTATEAAEDALEEAVQELKDLISDLESAGPATSLATLKVSYTAGDSFEFKTITSLDTSGFVLVGRRTVGANQTDTSISANVSKTITGWFGTNETMVLELRDVSGSVLDFVELTKYAPIVSLSIPYTIGNNMSFTVTSSHDTSAYVVEARRPDGTVAFTDDSIVSEATEGKRWLLEEEDLTIVLLDGNGITLKTVGLVKVASIGTIVILGKYTCCDLVEYKIISNDTSVKFDVYAIRNGRKEVHRRFGVPVGVKYQAGITSGFSNIRFNIWAGGVIVDYVDL